MTNLKAQLKLTAILFFGLISSMALATTHTVFVDYSDQVNTQTINFNDNITTYDVAANAGTITFDILHSYDKTNAPTALNPNAISFLTHYDSSVIEFVSGELLYGDVAPSADIADQAEAEGIFNDGIATTDRAIIVGWIDSSGSLPYIIPFTVICVDNQTFTTTETAFDFNTFNNICIAAGTTFAGDATGGSSEDLPLNDFPLVRYTFRWASTSTITTVTNIVLNFHVTSIGFDYVSTSNSDPSYNPNGVSHNQLTLLGTPTTSALAFSTAENSTAVGDIMGTINKGDDTPTSVVIDGGADADLFNIDFSADDGTAMLSFADAPNFEAPQGGANDSSNDYEVIVLITADTYQEAQTVTIRVTNVIEAPVLSGIPTLARVSSDYTFTPVVVNEEGKALTYTITGMLPSGLSFNTTTYTISGTPDTASTASVIIIAEFIDSGITYAGTLTIALTVEDKLDQTLAFGITTTSKTFGDADFTEAVVGDSSTAATVYSSSASTVATVVDGGTVTIVGAGTTIISADNAGDYDYNAISTSYVLTVAKADQPNFAFADDATRTITFISGGQVSAIVATGASGTGATTYASDNHNVAVATSTNGALAVQGAGVAIITATNAGDDNYNGVFATYTITIEKAEQIGFAFADTGPIEKIADEAPFTNTASGGLGDGDITYALTFTADDGGTATVATIDSATGEVTLIYAGIATITATKAASDDYNSTTAEYTLNVAEPFNLDIDGDGIALAGSDGVLIYRLLLGVTDPTKFTEVTTNEATRDGQETLDYMNANKAILDVDGDGIALAGSDGILIYRFILGVTDAAKFEEVATLQAIRSGAEIITYLNGIFPTN